MSAVFLQKPWPIFIFSGLFAVVTYKNCVFTEFGRDFRKFTPKVDFHQNMKSKYENGRISDIEDIDNKSYNEYSIGFDSSWGMHWLRELREKMPVWSGNKGKHEGSKEGFRAVKVFPLSAETQNGVITFSRRQRIIMMIGNTANTINMTYNALTATNKAIENTARALSTGLKAATAADDAAGFAMGIAMSAQVAGVDRAIRNSQDGISMLQTAEGGLSQVNAMLQRMRELSVQAANDSLTSQDRSYVQAEIDELRRNIDNVANTTTFNQKRLLDGSSTAQWSSDNANTKLKITGAITVTDQFGQKKATEGNYKIEVRANAGKGQIQKSNIIDLTVLKEEQSTDEVSGSSTREVKTVTEKKLHPASLEDIKAFKSASGVSYFTEPQTIRITQGDGRTANIIVYGGDTIYDVRRKINDAIADDLGQGAYTDNRENFCTIADGTSGTSESVHFEEDVEEVTYQRDADGKLVLGSDGEPIEIRTPAKAEKGTIVIRSAVAGKAGELTFSADNEDIVKALGLNTVQESQENMFTASVYDAHTGKVLAKNVETDGNTINGAIHPNASVEFDQMANVKATWDEGSKRYILLNEDKPYETTLHIQDRSTAFQIGQGRGEDIYINIGDMRAESLGLDAVDVTTRGNAARSITLLDAAIHKVSVQRSKLGSYQNELEYNTNSLKQTSIHLQESESRLKDADMAREYLDFVRLQILSQTGSSMLTQANQNSQSIMNILNL